MLEIQEVQKEEVGVLHQVMHSTFIDTFAHLNKPENFDPYVEKNLSLAKVKEEYSNDNSFFYFGRVNQEIVGYIKLNVKSAQTEQKDPDAVELQRIYVLSEHKGKGIGRLLMEYAIERGEEWDNSNIWLGVWENNTDAFAFYKKMKFFVFSTHVFNMGADPQQDFMMKREL